MLTLYKAQVVGTRIVPDLKIEATETLPELAYDGPQAHRERFNLQAAIVVDALRASLPGGTIDAITALLLDRARSILCGNLETTNKDRST